VTATPAEGEPGPFTPVRRFAHESEQRFARILDFYGVVWEYEPVEFALEWDDDGRPTAGFRPMGELYPDVRVTVLYQRDTLALLAKYGLAGDHLSRTDIARTA